MTTLSPSSSPPSAVSLSPRPSPVTRRPSILAAGITNLPVKNTVPDRPTEPTVFDVGLTSSPIFEFDETNYERLYPSDRCEDGSVKEPVKPLDFSDLYLFPTLTRNEMLRLKALWYYGRYIDRDKSLLSCLQDQVDLVNDFMQKDCVILGLLDHDYYRRIVTANVPLAILPRRESTCSHTIMQDSGRVFMIRDAERDWRFMLSPHVAEAGLRFYAGTQLRYSLPSADAEIAFGSLCVASYSPTTPLNATQQRALVKFADVIVHIIVERARCMRLAERERLTAIVTRLTKAAAPATICDDVLTVLRNTYPSASVNIRSQPAGLVRLANREPVPYDAFRDYIWEDDQAIKDWICANNHMPYVPSANDASMRAIACRMKYDERAYLVVETADMKHIFDEVDSWFVSSCTQLMCNTLQDELLRQTMDAKSRFLRGISHELRTPIHAILSSCELLSEETRDAFPLNSHDSNGRPFVKHAYLSEKALSMLGNIDSSGCELLGTINNLLDYDQFENKATVKVMQLHSLNIIEEEVLRETASAYATDQGVSIISDNRLPPGVEMLMTDFSLIKQCLGQLVRNAMKFTNSGTVIFQTILSDSHDILEYNIVDTGIGIPEREHERIFQAFEKVDQSARGAGLGLTVATRIAEVLGGSLKLVASCVGFGSHFQLQLRNPILACPINSYFKRILLDCEMPLTYSMPINHQVETVHLTYAARNLERMGFSLIEPEHATIALAEAKSASATFHDLFDSIRPDQVMIYICQTYSELRKSEEALQNKDYSRRFIRCLTPVRRGRLWQVVEDAVNAYRDLDLRSRSDSKLINPPSPIPPAITDKGWSMARQRRNSKRPRDALHILIVDDNPTNLGILVMYCKKRGFDYLTAVDGRDAHRKYLEAAADEKYVSLVLMDLDMPVRNGVDATHDIRVSESEWGLQPSMVVMVTGQNTDEDKKRSVQAGANGYYVKPLSMKTLDDLIQLHFPKQEP
ncbi:hypothetical protein TWF696_000069 [Orbilia brochopaga]|uniref:histidine kinase n=1 Tax=Orbilia brochopaga TaxID=3140254 RepID=A0AAV9VCZ1_9PEZI